MRLGALAHGGDRLACACDHPECTATDNGAPSATVVHAIAEERSLADDTPVQLDGRTPPRPGPDKPLREMTIAEALAPDPPTGPANTNPAVVIGGGIMPAPLLVAKVANTAMIRPLVHPGEWVRPEPRYVPSRQLADFARYRDISRVGSLAVTSPLIAARSVTTRSRIRWGRRAPRGPGVPRVENITAAKTVGDHKPCASRLPTVTPVAFGP